MADSRGIFAGFFEAAVGINRYEFIDLLSGHERAAARMGSKQIKEFVVYLRSKRIEDKLFLRWVIEHQFEMSFADFKKLLEPKKPVRSDEEIMNEVYAAFEKAGII